MWKFVGEALTRSAKSASDSPDARIVRLTSQRFLFQLEPPGHPLLHSLFVTHITGLIPHTPAEAFRQILLGDVRVFGIERVLVVLPVAEVFHEPGGRVANVQRDRLCRM